MANAPTSTPEAATDITSADALKTVTSECRDLLQGLQDSGKLNETEAELNAMVRNHLIMDASNYGIPVWEFTPGLNEEQALAVIDEVLARLEYNQDQDPSKPYGDTN